MSFPDVLDRGDEFLSQYPRTNPFWQIASHGTCLLAVGISKFMLNTFYNVKLNNLEKLQEAVARTKTENRGLMTVMNHMSVVDDPFIWGVFPGLCIGIWIRLDGASVLITYVFRTNSLRLSFRWVKCFLLRGLVVVPSKVLSTHRSVCCPLTIH